MVQERRKKAWINLKKLRKEKGLLQSEAAQKLGITREYLSAIENGKRGISMRMMSAMIDTFNLEYDDFYLDNRFSE